MGFQKAQKQKVKLRLAIEGPSGSGKTYSALRIANGLCPGGKIAVIDTENNSASLYADRFGFDVADLTPPYAPERYVELIKAAAKDYDVLIIDSASHEWSGEGGILDIHSRMPGNSFTNWARVNPKHNAFINSLLQAPCHIIATMRSKESYALDENDKGKVTPKKVGMEAVQRQGVAYEFSLVFTMDVSHQACATKDRTAMFAADQWFLPTEETGKQLRNWLESGVDAPAPAQQAPQQAPVEAPVRASNEVLLRIIKACDGDREKTLSELTQFLGREITSTKELTAAEAAQFLAAREQLLAEAA